MKVRALTDYELEFVSDVRSAKATGAADVGRSNARGVVEGASAGGRGMVSNAEIRRGVSDDASARDRGMVDDVGIGSMRGMSRSARLFEHPGMLKSGQACQICEAWNLRRSMLVESAKEHRLCASL